MFLIVGRLGEHRPQLDHNQKVLGLSAAHRYVLFGLHEDFLKRKLNHLPTLSIWRFLQKNPFLVTLENWKVWPRGPHPSVPSFV